MAAPRVRVSTDPRLTIATLAASRGMRYALTLWRGGHVVFRAQRRGRAGWWLDEGPRYVGALERDGALVDAVGHWTVQPLFDAHPASAVPTRLEPTLRRLLRAAARGASR